MPKSIIGANAVVIVPDATIYHFGVSDSIVHVAWMRIVYGRLNPDYRYAGSVVYNNYPLPQITEAQRARIEQTAQVILNARAL